MDPLTAIAERRIQEAIERGEFDDLPGKGKPLLLGEDDRSVREELRMAYRMLKYAGLLPPEVELHKEILRLTDLLDAVHDEEGRRERRRGARLQAYEIQHDASEAGQPRRIARIPGPRRGEAVSRRIGPWINCRSRARRFTLTE